MSTSDQKFVHLHVHSDYSLLRGMIKAKKLPSVAKKKGFDTVAITDRGAMYGAIEYYQACLKEGMKAIIGFEAFVCPRKMTDIDPELDRAQWQLVLLAEDYDGYRNLMLLCSEAQLNGLMDGVPRLDKETLRKYSKGIIALSGGITGEIPDHILSSRPEEAKAAALEYQDIFGKDNFYLELQDHPGIEGQLQVNNSLIELSKEAGIPMVVTRDVHYAEPDQAEGQDILSCIRQGMKVEYMDREDFRQVDRSMNTEEDILSRFKHVEEAVWNTGKIADRINIEIELDHWHFAPVDLPPNKTEDEALRDEAFELAPKFYPEMGQEIIDRLNYELDIIKTKGYSPYFICVADYVRHAKANGIVQSTRGSAAGSLVSYVMGITTVDPMRFKLPFERFLNPFRPSPPDIDTDFADDRREEMIQYMTDKYGKDKVAQIITFGTMAARGSVRDTGRALGMAYSFCDQVSKLIPQGAQGMPMTIQKALGEEPDLKNLYETNEEVTRLLDYAMQVEGLARHTSIHAAGVVVSPTPLTDFCPVQYETGGDRLTTQYEMHTIEAAGVLKNDFLGIRNLAILGNAVVIVEKTTGDKIDVYDLPLDDQKVFDMLARGETVGVFQLAGSGMTRWLKELKPTNIDDIMAMVALYRPGPMESIPEYIKRKYNPEHISFFDDRLKKILDASFGLLVYQDDVMLTAIELAGYNWMEADKFRKAMGKKVPEEMAKQKIKFYDGCKNYGKVPQKVIDEMWHAIEPFAAYGFNKAHAASYGSVAYQTAWMQAHYPVQYMTAVLAAEFGDSEKVALIVSECKRMSIEVLPPDINESFRNFAMVSKQGEPGRIRFGLTAIKGLGDNIGNVIYQERKANGPYKSLEDLLTRVEDKDLNKKSINAMTQAGALDCLGIDRAVLLASIDQILYFVKHHREQKISNQDSLFAGTSLATDNKVSLKQVPDASMDLKLVWEKQLLGLYISSHPLAKYMPYLESGIIPLNTVETVPRDSWVTIAGVIEVAQKKITKKGSVMAFVTLQDMEGSVEMLVFPKTYEVTKEIWKVGTVVAIVGKTPDEEGDNKVFVENVHVLSPENVESIGRQFTMGLQDRRKKEPKAQAPERNVSIVVTEEELLRRTNDFKTIFEDHPGEYLVLFVVDGQVIKTGSKISMDEECRESLEVLVPPERIATRNE